MKCSHPLWNNEISPIISVWSNWSHWCFIQNKKKIKTFWGWKSSEVKNIWYHPNFTGSYKKNHNVGHLRWKSMLGDMVRTWRDIVL